MARPMRVLFVGGPGRSGTSFVADRLGQHPQICAFPDIELKLFTEKNGLLDLHHALVESYSPNRATVAQDQFRRFLMALVDGRHGQPGLAIYAPREIWCALVDRFLSSLGHQGQIGPLRSETFHLSARRLLWRICSIANRLKRADGQSELFLEKTPHSLLSLDFLARMSPGCAFLHVMRDPRSVAFSLRSVSWGPNDLTSCCAWVANYCEAWLASQARAAHLGLPVTCVKIEAVATSPEELGESLCSDLNLATQQGLFKNADLSTLNGWSQKCPLAELEELNKRLAGWISHFGYARENVGALKSQQTVYAA